ncbi:tyrosine-type recombinase/integrase [Clostridioides difficile]|uniref:tyrosine-type recombinase/integrase n=1 Tax=Clostridioides difficile TaxID=1496 RepID=UPI0018C30D11|nr:site-specific integrase [Clostridioides difficile]MBF9991458.1 site-specific integrase [Clostridioides difficile]MBZ4462716.1 site-specific integrase [Clostridioides difficile]MCJ0114938.1 site-specific integrase [Clostridioides difficile]MDB2881961.1 site-specific integrase [Clostridioides difficile]MDB3068682.1 site-specific integrase [Clostridioides difficile]
MKGGVRKRGEKWYYYFDLGAVNGKRKKIERVGGKTKKEAEKALRDALSEFENEGQLFSDNEMSFSDFLDFWYKEYVLLNCKYGTQKNYEKIIKNHLKPDLGKYKLKNLNPAILQKFLNDKSRFGLSKNSINNFYGVLSGALKSAVYPFKFIKENPMQYVHMPKMQENKKNDLKIISLKDFNKILERFPQGSSFYIPLQIAFNTGMRGGEVTALQWDDIDLENKIIHVRHTLISKGKEGFELGTPKTESSYRKINIGDTLTKVLREHKKLQKEMKLKFGEWYINSNFVCTKEMGEHVTTNSLKYLSRVVNYELGIDFNFHSLRHTHATMLLENGANIKDIQHRLGHAKISTTMDTYSHVTNNMRNQRVNIFESIVE